MHRFYLPPEECKGDLLVLTGGEAHHALHVLRLQRGETVVVLNGVGGEFACEIQDGIRDRIQLAVQKTISHPPPPFQVTLLQGIPRGKLIETIIQKATELGVARVVPVLTERVATRLDEYSAREKAEKWQSVAIEATKQCGSAWLPKVEIPVTPDKFLARRETFDLPLIASLQPGSRHARDCFNAFRTRTGRLPQSVCVWVGPEGDFTAAEVAAVESSGAQPISLGPRVLRSDTAATYCLSILNHELLFGSASGS